MNKEPTYLEKLESYLVDQFHHGLHRIMVETIWSDVGVGEWSDQMKFFNCLQSEHEYLMRNRTKPLQVEIHVRDLNFSGRVPVNGLRKNFLESRLVCSRQKILLLHSLRLMLLNRQNGSDLTLVIPLLRREIHQCLRLIFFNLQGETDKNKLQDFVDDLDRFEYLEMRDGQSLLAAYVITWLERQGIRRVEVDDLKKLRQFFFNLTRWISYHPQQTPCESIQFDYVEVFRDWQKVGFFSSLHYEIDRLTSLIYLERLSHSHGHTLDVLTGVADRASFETEIERWMTRARSDGHSFVLAMFDVDDFKAINSAYGHPGGDFVLKSVAELFKKHLDPDDFIARWGDKGDEFAILTRDTLSTAEQKLESCRILLANSKLEYQPEGVKRQISATVSCGLAESQIQDDKNALIRNANQAMHDAKNGGKNQIICFSPSVIRNSANL